MDEQTARSVAAQLRKPSGEWAEQISEFMSRGNALLIQRSIDAMCFEEGCCVLEVGMGNGMHVQDIMSKNKNGSYTGYDYSEDMVSIATGVNQELAKHRDVTFVSGNASAMPFKDNSFHQILTVNTIYFWDDVVAITNELKRVLKKQGQLVVGMRPEELMKTYPMTKWGFTLYTAEGAKSLLEEHGFNVTSVKEEKEPEQEVDGEMLQLSSLIITANLK